MDLFDKDNPGAEPQKSKATDYTGVIIGAILCPVFFFFRYIGKTDLGLNVGLCLGMFLFAIRIRWDLRTRPWFWIVVTLVLVLHVPLFFLIQWPDTWVPGAALLPFGIADLLIFLGVVRFVENFIVKAPPPDEGA
jgi:hypothetical protein